MFFLSLVGLKHTLSKNCNTYYDICGFELFFLLCFSIFLQYCTIDQAKVKRNGRRRGIIMRFVPNLWPIGCIKFVMHITIIVSKIGCI